MADRYHFFSGEDTPSTDTSHLISLLPEVCRSVIFGQLSFHTLIPYTAMQEVCNNTTRRQQDKNFDLTYINFYSCQCLVYLFLPIMHPYKEWGRDEGKHHLIYRGKYTTSFSNREHFVQMLHAQA